ncbi:MAG: hypothetical protein QOH67_1402 [Hyphomicrobiales bacterium]|jgi:hypothetical protein|nr:hypothetical protein [Hyphomicrobiales bacterium]
MAARGSKPQAEVSKPEDRVLLESPLGRENDFGSDPGTIAEEEIRHPEITSRPKSTITGRHDEGSGANETIDGFDEYQEAIRHAAEDIPASEKPGDDFEKLPVFDRAESERKI